MIKLVWESNASPSYEVPELIGIYRLCVNMLRADEAITISQELRTKIPK